MSANAVVGPNMAALITGLYSPRAVMNVNGMPNKDGCHAWRSPTTTALSLLEKSVKE